MARDLSPQVEAILTRFIEQQDVSRKQKVELVRHGLAVETRTPDLAPAYYVSDKGWDYYERYLLEQPPAAPVEPTDEDYYRYQEARSQAINDSAIDQHGVVMTEMYLQSDATELEAARREIEALRSQAAELEAVARRALRAMYAQENKLNWDDSFDLEYGYAMNAIRYALGMTELMPPSFPDEKGEQS